MPAREDSGGVNERRSHATRTLMCRVAGWAAMAVSGFLLAFVLFGSRVGINVGNSLTIFGCGLAGFIAVVARGRWMIVASIILMIVGAAPALIGGVAWLYLPSVLVLVVALVVPDR